MNKTPIHYLGGGRIYTRTNGTKTGLIGLILAAAMMAPLQALLAAGPAPVNLGSTAHFTILAGAAITTTGGGIINGDVGASPIAGSAIHLAAAQVHGIIYAADATGPIGSVIDPTRLTAAKSDLTTAYNDAAGRTPVPSGPFLNPGAGNLGGLNLVPGLYKFTGTALLSGGDLTLTGGPDDVWIFQVASDLQVASTMHVILAGGAQARNIFWQVGSSATIGTFAVFKGTIMADQAITLDTSSTLEGRALAFSAGVTFNSIGGSLPAPKAPVFTVISRPSPNSVSVVLSTTPYFLLTLQQSPSLSAPSWTTVVTNTPSTSPWTFIDNTALVTVTQRFYRAFITSY
jgi:Ice-binding-like